MGKHKRRKKWARERRERVTEGQRKPLKSQNGTENALEESYRPLEATEKHTSTEEIANLLGKAPNASIGPSVNEVDMAPTAVGSQEDDDVS